MTCLHLNHNTRIEHDRLRDSNLHVVTTEQEHATIRDEAVSGPVWSYVL